MFFYILGCINISDFRITVFFVKIKRLYYIAVKVTIGIFKYINKSFEYTVSVILVYV